MPTKRHLRPRVAIAHRQIEEQILLLRGEKVLLDTVLAKLYGVSTKRLNEQVRRNRERFPTDFMFQLTAEETDALRSQSATSIRGGRRYLPYAFTEHGIAMLSSVLHSERAIQINITIMRAFVRLRRLLATHHALARKLLALERQTDKRFRIVFVTLRQLIAAADGPGRRIGFHRD